MRRIAIHSLLFDRGKLIAALLGVALATTLAFVQIGLYRGFQVSSSTVIDHFGGDVWATPTGLEVLDNAEVISAAPRNLLLSHPCVKDVRGLVYGFVLIRKPQGTRDTALVVGAESREREPLPWAVVGGHLADLQQPLRVSVDSTDLAKLQLLGDPMGKTFEVSGQQVKVAAVTQGIRSFTLSPVLFTSINNARRLLGVAETHVHYLGVSLKHPGCVRDLEAWISQLPDVTLIPKAAWMKRTEDYWVRESGAGTVLAVTAALGLVVGAVIVGQTLYSMTKQHLPELATLKALGARQLELAGFVMWQVAALALLGGGVGMAFAFFLRHLLAASGLTVVLSVHTVALGAAATVLMCVVASAASLRTVFEVEAAAVLR